MSTCPFCLIKPPPAHWVAAVEAAEAVEAKGLVEMDPAAAAVPAVVAAMPRPPTWEVRSLE